MRVRIKEMRSALVEKLKAAGVQQDMSFITQQIGMFSYSGLTQGPDGAPAQRVRRVRHRQRPHLRGGAQHKNIDYVAECIAKVV
jgi:aromatic-amino-acid transaminase